ncbi:hypothetical protein ABMA27_011772 [Loxostege sticticalis]|uniref:COMM domain-containing protein n=1 Tax=Loxostege sticticalis TaxID=481309 RepID=A0ABR3IHG4_LOXSC
MIIFLSELQKEHLNILHSHSTQVLVDFCKLAIDYLNNGINQKKYTNAADKMDLPVNTIQNLVYALTYLLVEACKHNLSEPDFKSSIAIAGFSSEHQEVLVKLYATKKAELSGALNLLHQKEPTYQDLTWRFEIQVASQGNLEEIKPSVAMDFVLMTPKIFSQSKDNKRNKTDPANRQISPTHVNVPIQDAKAASQCQNVINHILLQCDLPNLVHMTNKLDQALKESKSQHVRKVQRAL